MSKPPVPPEWLRAATQAVADNIAFGLPSITGVGYDEELAERNPWTTRGIDALFLLTGGAAIAKGIGKFAAKRAGRSVAQKATQATYQRAAQQTMDDINRTYAGKYPTVDEMAEAFDPAIRQIRADKAELETMRPLLERAARKQKKAAQVDRINDAAFQALTQGKRERANRLMTLLSDYRVKQEDAQRIVERALQRMPGPRPPISETTKDVVENLYRAGRGEPPFTTMEYTPFMTRLLRANDAIPLRETNLGKIPFAEQLRRQPELPTFRAKDATPPPVHQEAPGTLHLLEPDDLFRVQQAAQEGPVPLALLRESIERALQKRRGMAWSDAEKQKLLELMDRQK